jgi:hypothetical protein
MLAPVVVESEARGVPYEAVAGGVDAAELEPLKKSTIEPLGRADEWGGVSDCGFWTGTFDVAVGSRT